MNAVATISKLGFLQNTKVFNSLSPSDVERLEQMVKFQTRSKHDYIYYPDETSSRIYFLKKGRVKVGSYSDDGREVIKSILYPGAIFGELGLIGEEVRKDFAMTMDNGVEVCEVAIHDFMQIMHFNPKLSLTIINEIGSKLRAMEDRLESLVFKNARTRIVDFIKGMADSRGVKVGYETLVRKSPTHRDIANITGTSRQTVTAVIGELKRNGVIHTERKNILIRNMEDLQ